MEIAERTVAEIMQEPAPDPDGVGWFVARQPAILRHLERRLGGDDDVFAAALAFAWRSCAAFEREAGVPPARIIGSALEAAEAAVAEEARARPIDGLASRQPELCRRLVEFLEDPPVAMTPEQAVTAGLALAAILWALDERFAAGQS